MHPVRKAAHTLLILCLPLLAACGSGGSDPGYVFVVQPTDAFIAQGSSASLDISLVRFGFGGLVTVRAEDLPSGVSAESAVIGDGETEGRVLLRASLSAAMGVSRVTLISTGGGLAQRSTTIVLRVNGRRGEFDLSFGVDGVVLTPITNASSGEVGEGHVADVMIQPDQKIVVAGTVREKTADGVRWRWIFIRYLADGRLDLSFDGDGIATHDIASYEGEAEVQTMMRGAIRSQVDGKFLAVGGARESDGTYSQVLAKFNLDGSPDTSFGTEGVVRVTVGEDGAYDLYDLVEVPEEGHPIIVVGESPGGAVPTEMCVRRHLSDGSVDTSFGVAGTVQHAVLGFDSGARRVGRRSDGKLRVGGWVRRVFDAGPDNTDITVVGFDATGGLDRAYAAIGEAWLDVTDTDELTDMKLRDGHALVVGTIHPSLPDSLIARFHTSGFADRDFPTQTVSGSGPLRLVFAAVTELPDLSKWVVGRLQAAGEGAIVARYEDDGTSDEGLLGFSFLEFDGSFGTVERADAVTSQRDRRIVIAGTSDGRFAVARNWP